MGWINGATRGEEERLLMEAASHLRPLIIVAVDTGGRRGELLGLDWRDVDLAPDFQAQAIDKLNAFGTFRAQSPETTNSTSPPETRNPKVSLGVSMVGAAGIEPATPTMST